MSTKLQLSLAKPVYPINSMSWAAVLAGVIALSGLGAPGGRAHASSGLCAAGTACERSVQTSPEENRAYRYDTALQRTTGPDGAQRHVQLSDKDYSTFSGIGVIACSVDGRTRSSTAFLVGAFDIGVTVAHLFEDARGARIPATDCVYNSMDSLGQIRERIPVSYVKSQWEAQAGAFGQPSKDLAVVRLSRPSSYARRTMPLGRFSGEDAPVVMIGFRSDPGSGTIRRKSRGTVYERHADDSALPGLVELTHDMDSRGIAAGAPVIDARSGVIIGLHTRLDASHNAVITMNDWLEATLRTEMQSHAQSRAN